MEAGPETLSCGACGSYVHPFLGACPACGVARRSRYEDAIAAPDLGLRALLADPLVIEQVRQVVLRYTMKLNREPEAAPVRAGLAIVANSLAYRVPAAGMRTASSETGHLDLIEDVVVIREHNPSREIHRVRLDAILAIGYAAKGQRRADAWAGLVFDGRPEQASPPSLDGDLVVTHAGDTGLARFALANRRGIFVASARADHFEIVTRWLGMLAGAAAEERWMAVGPRRYAVQLGLVAAPADVPHGGDAGPATPAVGLRGAGDGEPGAPGGAASVKEALHVLEELRAAGLVSDAEYAAKRSEILDRL